MCRWSISFALALAWTLPAAAAPRSIVLLIADDLGMEVGCYGDADRCSGQGWNALCARLRLRLLVQ